MSTIDEAASQTLAAFRAEYDRLSPTRMDEDRGTFDAASDENLHELQRAVDVDLPAPLLAFLRQNTMRHTFEDGFECLCWQRILERWQEMTAKLEDGAFDGLVEMRRSHGNWSEGRMREVWWSRGWIPFAEDSNGNLLCIDIDPGEDGWRGQILYMDVIGQHGPWLTDWADFGDFLAQQLTDLKFNRRRELVDEFVEREDGESFRIVLDPDGYSWPLREDDENEHLVVYELDEVPAVFTRALPTDVDPRRCLFWIAHGDSPTISKLFDTIPEPDIDHVTEGMELAERMMEFASSNWRLAEFLRPDEWFAGLRTYSAEYSFGFHAAPKAEVRAFFESADCVIHSLDEFISTVLVVRVTDQDGNPVDDAKFERKAASSRSLPMTEEGGGFYTRDSCWPLYGPYEISAPAGTTVLETLPPYGLVEVQLSPE